MALPSSGQISLGQVNTELGLTSTLEISMNQTTVRTLFAKASGQIAMSDGWGKSNATPTPTPTPAPTATPTPTPTSSCPAYGTFLYSYCVGPDQYQVFADGSCGTYEDFYECALWACSGTCN